MQLYWEFQQLKFNKNIQMKNSTIFHIKNYLKVLFLKAFLIIKYSNQIQLIFQFKKFQ